MNHLPRVGTDMYFKKNFNPWFANKKCFRNVFMPEKGFRKREEIYLC